MCHEGTGAANEIVAAAVVLEGERKIALQDLRASVHNDRVHTNKPKRRTGPPLQVINQDVAQAQRKETWLHDDDDDHNRKLL